MHIVARVSLAAVGASIVGAIATAEADGPVHFVFAGGVLVSLLTMATALVAHGHDVLRCRRCTNQVAQSFDKAAPRVTFEQPAEVAQPAEPVSAQLWWAV